MTVTPPPVGLRDGTEVGTGAGDDAATKGEGDGLGESGPIHNSLLSLLAAAVAAAEEEEMRGSDWAAPCAVLAAAAASALLILSCIVMALHFTSMLAKPLVLLVGLAVAVK